MMPPCDECGALCPGSSWTRADDLEEAARTAQDWIDRVKADQARNVLYEEWLTHQEVYLP